MMITYKLKDDELIITGSMHVGEKISGLCCPGHDWEVLTIFPDDDPGFVSVWGKCENLECPAEKNDPFWHGVSSYLQEDIADMLLEAHP